MSRCRNVFRRTALTASNPEYTNVICLFVECSTDVFELVDHGPARVKVQGVFLVTAHAVVMLIANAGPHANPTQLTGANHHVPPRLCYHFTRDEQLAQ